MKKLSILFFIFYLVTAAQVQLIKSNPELAPRGDVHVLYSPREFSPSSLTLTYSVGESVSASGTPFIIQGSNPVTVDNGEFTLAAYDSGQVRVLVGSEVVTIEPSIIEDGSEYLPKEGIVQVFPGKRMTYLVWELFNETFQGHRVVRLWYDKPWMEVETFISSDNNTMIDFKESISNINVGTSSADNVKFLSKNQLYEGPVFSSTIIPTEGWMLFYEGDAGFGLSLEGEEWNLSTSGSSSNLIVHDSIILDSGVQESFKSYYQVMTDNLNFRNSQANFRSGWKYLFNSSTDWVAGEQGRIDDGNRFENSSFLLPQPEINASLSSISFDISALNGSNPRLECELNDYQVFEEIVHEPGQIRRVFPARWLEWGNNTLNCYADGGIFYIPQIHLSLAAVEGMDWVYGGDDWSYASVNVLTNSSGNAMIDLDVRDLGISRDYSTLLVLDSTLNHVRSDFNYPVLSFNSSLRENVTNTFFVVYGNGESFSLSGTPVAGSLLDYEVEVVGSGGFGLKDVERTIHKERGIPDRQIPDGVTTGGAETMIYDDGLGALFSLVVWR